MKAKASTVGFNMDDISDDVLVLLLYLKRNLDDPKVKTKTQEHPIIKQFTEVMKLIYLGEK